MDRIRCAVNVFLGATLTLATGGATAQVVTTFAGSGAKASVDGTGSAASFSNPMRVSVDAAGNVHVPEWGSSAHVRKITRAGVVSTLPGTLRFPRGVAPDSEGAVYVAEQSYWSYGGASDADIRKITRDGQVTTFVTLYSDVMWIGGLARDASGNLIVADEGDTIDGGLGKLLRVSPAGVVTPVTGPGTPFKLQNPADVAVDRAGNLYVTDWGSVLRLGADGSTTVLASG